MKKSTKIILWVLAALFVFVITLLVALPEFIRSYIEENDRELIGREIFIKDLDINYFKGVLRVKEFDLKEADGDTSFVKFNFLEVNIQPWHLLKNSFYVQSYYLEGLDIRVLQDGNTFNFTDIINHTDSVAKANQSEETEIDTSSAEPWSFTIENLEVRNTSLEYSSDLYPRLKFDSIMVRVPIASDTMDVIHSFTSLNVSTGGDLLIENKVYLPRSFYEIDLMAHELDLEIIKPYLDPFMKTNSLEGNFNSKLFIGGSWEDTDVLNVGGHMDVKDFKLTNESDQTVLAMRLGELDIDSIRLKDGYYRVEHLLVDSFYGIYEMYDDGDTYSNMLIYESSETDSVSSENSVGSDELNEEDYSNPFVLASHYIKDIARSYNESSYKVSEIKVENSAFNFNDYTTSDPFRYSLTDMYLHADSLNSENETLTFDLSSTLNNAGNFEGYLKLYTDNLQNIDLHYEVRGTDLSPFSPYTSDYVDYPIELGDLTYVNDTKIRNGVIVSQNIMDANQFTWGKKSDGDSFYNLPVKLAVSLLRDLDGNIHLDVPVEGNLHDPSFKLGKVIWSTVKNIIVKAVSAPFRLIANMFKMDEENLKKIRFNLTQFRLDKDHTKQLDDLYKVLDTKKDLNIEFKRITKKYEEVERYAIMEAKYRYLISDNDIPEVEEVEREHLDEIAKLDVKDSLFVDWVARQFPQKESPEVVVPVQKQCIDLVGEERAIEKTDRIGQLRTEAIRAYLVDEKGLEPERLRFRILPEDSLITHRSNTIFNVGFWVEE